GLILAATLLLLPITIYAQEEAVISGRITDSSGGVLPGVTVRAVHEATGNAFQTVTDGLGAYRMSVRVGGLRVTAELQGFAASNRFDATQGRSTGAQVNVITKSGTNQLSGLFRGNFRNSSLNSKNRVLDLVEPIDNQQYSTAVGGPVLRDKLHFFANYEFEREPRTSIWRTPYPFFNVSLKGTNNR